MSERLLLRGLAGEPSALLVTDGHIAAIGSDAEVATDASVVECAGLRAAPGFIELQINGVDDHDFTTDPAAMWQVGERLAQFGVTAFLPTIITSPPGTVERALHAFGDRPSASAGAIPLGLHVEGPFISPMRRGAHDERFLRDPDPDEVAAWAARGARILTLAPELPRGLEAIGRATAAGAVASVGHTDADADTVGRAIDAGARYATHLFNAMPRLHHRAPGAVGALLDDERVTVGIIADGVHLDARLLRLVARAAAGRVSLVSDAVSRRLGDATLAVDAGSARLPDGTLAGSVHQLDHGVRTYATATGSVSAALEAVTSVPARLLGLSDGRGSLRAGGRADIVLLDDHLGVVATIVDGRPAYVADGVGWS